MEMRKATTTAATTLTMQATATPGDDTDAPDDVLDKLVGSYWMRSVASASSTASGVTVRSDVSTFSLVKIERSGDALTMVDWQCEQQTKQTCAMPGALCANPTSDARLGDSQAYRPARRVLSVSGDGWSAGASPYAVGWKWDFAAEGEHATPTSDSDALVYDPGEPNGGGKGVNVASRIETTLGPVECALRVVQRIDFSFEGSLTDGKLSTGTVTDLGSVQNILDDGTCNLDGADLRVARRGHATTHPRAQAHHWRRSLGLPDPRRVPGRAAHALSDARVRTYKCRKMPRC